MLIREREKVYKIGNLYNHSDRSRLSLLRFLDFGLVYAWITEDRHDNPQNMATVCSRGQERLLLVAF